MSDSIINIILTGQSKQGLANPLENHPRSTNKTIMPADAEDFLVFALKYTAPELAIRTGLTTLQISTKTKYCLQRVEHDRRLASGQLKRAFDALQWTRGVTVRQLEETNMTGSLKIMRRLSCESADETDGHDDLARLEAMLSEEDVVMDDGEAEVVMKEGGDMMETEY